MIVKLTRVSIVNSAPFVKKDWRREYSMVKWNVLVRRAFFVIPTLRRLHIDVTSCSPKVWFRDDVPLMT